jgi:Flp pilus assembly protein TadB
MSVDGAHPRVLRGLAEMWPGSVDATTPDLERSLRFLGWDLAAETVVAASYVVGVVAAVVAAPPLVVLLGVSPLSPLVAGAVGIVAGYAVHRAPVVAARVRRTRALGEVPGVLARAVLRMRIEPTTESAAAFAARTGRGRLAESLCEHVERARSTPRSGLSSFAEEWSEWFPALQRATGLVVTAADAPPRERGRTLDRAMQAVLDGTRDQMATFAKETRTPATALYAFGVLLPLALVAVLPAARAAGVGLSLPVLVVVYDLLLPAVVVAGSLWLLVRRPVAFPPPSVDHTHPDVPARRVPAAAVGVGGALGAGLSLSVTFPWWTVPLGAAGIGVGGGLVWHYHPVVAVQRRVRAVESDLPDALYLVGRRVTEGEAVETAVERAAAELSGETSEVFGSAARVGRRLRVDLRESLLGPRGALANVPSSRAKGTAALLSIAAEEGKPAGRAVISMADHLDELERVEQEARRELARVTGTLRHTAAVFGPLVAGATVAVAERLRLAGGVVPAGPGTVEATTPTTSLPVDGIGLSIGVYVLFLATLLSALSTGLRRGLHPALVGYRTGWALLSATTVFLVTLRVTSALV